MDVLVSPLKVVNDPLVSEFLFKDEDVLEEFQDSLFNIKVIKFSDHSLLVFEIPLILVYQSIPLVNDTADIIEN